MAYKSLLLLFFILLMSTSTWAHVQLIVPKDKANDQKTNEVTLDIRFVHHAADDGPIINMPKPKSFGVLLNGNEYDLLETLKPEGKKGAQHFTLPYTFKEPGAHVFFMEPSPYVDDEEKVMIIHYTKVILDTAKAGVPTPSELGWEGWEGWDQRVGFPVEIMPLNQPTALWTGNTFRAVAYYKGQPAANCRIEIEHWDNKKDGKIKRPTNAYKTQLLKTNALGEFSFTAPVGGWWIFTAIPETKDRLEAPDGGDYAAELGGVLLVHFENNN